MAQSKNKRRRRRNRGSLGPLMRLVSVVLSAVIVVAALTLFFKVDRFEVAGNSRYTAEEIIAVSGVERGDNLILMDKYSIAKKIYTGLPYITDVRLSRELPEGLLIEVTETKVSFAMESGGAWWLLSDKGKVLDASDAGGAAEYLLLRGAVADGISVGGELKLTEGSRLSVERVLELMTALDERGMLEYARTVDLSDEKILRIGYDDRFEVEMYYDADFNFKLDCLQAVVGQLEPNEQGIIRMTMDDEYDVRFIPNVM